MTESYSLFVDESGEEGGLLNVRTTSNPRGSPPWFALGAALIKDSDIELAKEIIYECEQTLNKTNGLHFKTMDHKQKVYVCKKLSTLDITFFGVISNKLTLDNGEYISAIDAKSYKYYNKNAQYLFERVGSFFQENNIGINDHNIIFEHKNCVDYEKMKNFLSKISQNPLRDSLKPIKFINPKRITSKTKAEEDLLKIADCVAHALFQCCETSSHGVTETRYLRELKNKFYCDSNGGILETGIKPINYLKDLKLYAEDSAFLANLRNDAPLKKQIFIACN